MHLRLSLFFLKSAPGEILSSADKWAMKTTRTVELFSLKACTTVRRLGKTCATRLHHQWPFQFLHPLRLVRWNRSQPGQGFETK